VEKYLFRAISGSARRPPVSDDLTYGGARGGDKRSTVSMIYPRVRERLSNLFPCGGHGRRRKYVARLRQRAEKLVDETRKANFAKNTRQTRVIPHSEGFLRKRAGKVLNAQVYRIFPLSRTTFKLDPRVLNARPSFQTALPLA